MPDPGDPIADDEIILRRVPDGQMANGWPLAAAFSPSRNDTDGLSLYRRAMHTPEEVASFRTRGTAPVWIACLSAGSIRSLGLTLQADPLPPGVLPAQPGHLLVPEMNAERRKSPEVEQWKEDLRNQVSEVHGPFAAPTHA